MPFGPNYSFAFLWDSLRCRVADDSQAEAKIKHEQARENEINKVLAQAARKNGKQKGSRPRCSSAGRCNVKANARTAESTGSTCQEAEP